MPLEKDLPSPAEYINKEFVDRFAGKQGWALPHFWFTPHPAIRKPGRPSNMDAIVQEFERRMSEWQTLRSHRAECRVLADWSKRQFGRETKPGTIQNVTRTAYKLWKADQA